MGFTFRNDQFACIALLTLILLQSTYSTTLKGIFTSDSILTRVPRDNKYLNRYDSRTDENDKNLKPEESHDVGENAAASVGKRCSRCDNNYYYDRYPIDRSRYYYDDRRREYDRYDDRYYDKDRYDRDHYTSDRDRYYDRYDRYDKYPSRGGTTNRYDNRYGDRYSDRYNDYDRYDRYDPYSRYDRYDRYDKYDKYDRYDRYTDRGVGYDNRGYDYREGYRPLDETYRGSSGFDSAGRGYYFASGRPDYGTSGYGYGNNRYASGWDYGGTGAGRDDYYRDKG